MTYSDATMLSVTFSVGSVVTYSNRFLDMPTKFRDIKVDLEDGEHTFTSPDFRLGTLIAAGSRALLGRLTFRYTYNAKNQVITVCGTDFPSADGMSLITVPKGSEEMCIERAAPSCGFVADEVHRNPTWNYHSQLMPGAAGVIRDIVRGANDSLIAALTAQSQLNVQVRNTLPQLPLDHYPKLCVVKRDGKLLEFFDETHSYHPKDEVKLVDSVFGGVVTMSSGENFANVIGSTNDPKIASMTWIQLWISQFGNVNPTACTSQNYNGFPCNTPYVGGHVITGQSAKVVAAGSNSVYIYPICNAHNNNDNVYMAALQYLKGVWLKNYLGN